MAERLACSHTATDARIMNSPILPRGTGFSLPFLPKWVSISCHTAFSFPGQTCRRKDREPATTKNTNWVLFLLLLSFCFVL